MTDPFNPDNIETNLPPDYYTATGRLTHAFAVLEVDLASWINVFVGDRVGAPTDGYRLITAIVGGMRFEPLRDTIKRLLRVADIDKATRLYVDGLFAHLSEIQWLRNRLHHNLTLARDGDGYSLVNTDMDTVREIEKAHSFGLTPAAISAAATDIYVFLDALGAVAEAIQDRETFGNPPQPAWRYKPSMLVR